jgi:PhoH-like ATPase
MLTSGTPYCPGGTLQIWLDFKADEEFGLNPAVMDNRILFAALNAKKTFKKLIFVSKDLNARIKAASVGLLTEDYEKSKVKIDELYKGWNDIVVDENQISEFYKNKKLKLDYQKYNDGTNFYDNFYAVLKSDSNQQSSALCCYSKKEDAFVPLKTNDPFVWGVKALNVQQKFAFDTLLRDDISLVTLVGQAGTGKTLVAIAAGLMTTIDEHKYNKVLIARPVIPMGKDIGFLPGSKDEKLHYWMQPIFDNMRFIFDKTSTAKKNPDEEIRYLMSINKIELEALTYIRGRSIPKQFLIVDEAQNLSPHEIKTIISRAGEGTKIVLTGDPYQIDNPYLDSSSNGLTYTVDKFKGQSIFSHIQFVKSERSKLAALAADLL